MPLLRAHWRRLEGGALILWGALALYAPLATGAWSLALLAVPLLVLSVAEARAAFASPRRGEIMAYLPSLLALLAAVVVFFGPALVVGGLLILLAAGLAIDGGGKIVSALRSGQVERMPLLVNGVVDVALALLLFLLRGLLGTVQAVGIAVGLYVAAAGWRMLLAPAESAEHAGPVAASEHPDRKLGLASSDALAALRAQCGSERRYDAELILTLALVFFAIHLGRMSISESWLGAVSPFVATAGDFLMTIALAAFLLLPARLLWRRLTRPLERLGWTLRLRAAAGSAPMNAAVAWSLAQWLDWRYRFALRLREARVSLPAALLLLLRLGLPLTAFFVAINPIWGFTWYFNTESWASGIYQKLTELRVDPWRVAMVDAVARAYGETDDRLFRIDPAGVDRRFQLPGDRRYRRRRPVAIFAGLELSRRRPPRRREVPDHRLRRDLSGRRDERLRDQLLSAVPRAGKADLRHPRQSRLVRCARRLQRQPPGARGGARGHGGAGRGRSAAHQHQSRPHRATRLPRRRACGGCTASMSASSARRSSSCRPRISRCWRSTPASCAASTRSNGPGSSARSRAAAASSSWRSSGIRASPAVTTRATDELAALYALLARNGVTIAMAGDTHDFEYYREPRAGEVPLHHFVNGGGGAYLSIGTALDFARPPALADSAIYPGAAVLREKLAAETPLWKQPVWLWIKWLGAWPFTVEALSGVFDFNRAPFFQSFMEVRVESSRTRVVLVLRTASTGRCAGAISSFAARSLPAGALPDDPVEFIIPAPAALTRSVPSRGGSAGLGRRGRSFCPLTRSRTRWNTT